MLVVLCHPSDVPPEEGERDRWLDFFHPGGDDPGNLIRYLTDISLGRYDSSTVMVTDWLDVGHTVAEAAAVGGIPQRRLLGDWGKAAAINAGFDLDAFPGVVLGYNIDSDHGSLGGSSAVLAYRSGRPFEPTFMFHEIGHVLGLAHSRSETGGEYGDYFDIMSAMSVWRFRDAWNRDAGPALTGISLYRLDWLDDGRIYFGNVEQDPHADAVGVNFSLTPLYRPDIAPETPRMAVMTTPVGTYYIEYREQVGWDAGLPGPRVLIHRDEGVPVILGSGPEPLGALAPGAAMEIPDDPAPWTFIFQTIYDNGCAEVGLWATYL